MAVVHLAYTGHNRGEGADNRHKLGQGHGLTTVAFKELLGVGYVLLLKQAPIGAVKDLGANLATD